MFASIEFLADGNPRQGHETQQSYHCLHEWKVKRLPWLPVNLWPCNQCDRIEISLRAITTGASKKREARHRTATTAGHCLIRGKTGIFREMNYQALRQAKKKELPVTGQLLGLLCKRNEDQSVRTLAVVYQKQFEVTLLPCLRSGTVI